MTNVMLTRKDTPNEAWDTAMAIFPDGAKRLRVHDPLKICPDEGFWSSKGAEISTEELYSYGSETTPTEAPPPTTKSVAGKPSEGGAEPGDERG